MATVVIPFSGTSLGERTSIPLSDSLKRRLKQLNNDDWTRPRLPEGAGLSHLERETVKDRIAAIVANLKPGEEAAILAPVAELLFAYPPRDGEAKTAKVRARIFLRALNDLPAGAVQAACDRWGRGEGLGKENFAFPPAPAELRAIALEAMRPFREEQVQLQQLLKARTETSPTPDEARRIASKAEAATNSLAAAASEQRTALKLRPISEATSIALAKIAASARSRAQEG